jgi:hypothetical protein
VRNGRRQERGKRPVGRNADNRTDPYRSGAPALLPHIYFDIYLPLPLRTRIMDRTGMDGIRQALPMAGFQFNASISIKGGK